uniref:NS7b n=1 Tax=Bat coronavirus HKU9 TaxID=694006 RepID=A0A2P1M5J8_BCHK9|nr:NS7b [Rousettus bat coronavirus HKU9]
MNQKEASQLAASMVINMLQAQFVTGADYGFSVQGPGKVRAQGWCLAQLARRRMLGRRQLVWTLPVLMEKPDLLLKVARVVPLTSSNVLAFACICYMLLRTEPSFRYARVVYVSLSCLFGRLDLKYCFGYLNHPKHGWPKVIYQCLHE